MIAWELESPDSALTAVIVLGLEWETGVLLGFTRAFFKKNFLSSFILDGTVALPVCDFLFLVLFVIGLNVLLLFDPSPDCSFSSFMSEVESLYR